MKKCFVLGTAIIFAFFSLSSCAKKPGIPVAGKAKAEDLLTLLPADATGVLVVDIHGALNTEIIDKAIKTNKDYQEYQKFIQETGLDPQKDVYFLAFAISGIAGPNIEQGAAVINLKYKKDSLIAKLKEKEPNLAETTYNGVTILSWATTEEGKKPGGGAFLDDSNIVVGTEDTVKAVIDVYQKKGKSVLNNPDLAPLIKKANKKAMIWSAFLFPPESMQKLAAQNPMVSSLEALKSMTMNFDYKNKNVVVEIMAMGPEEAKIKEIASMLNGLKALGGAAAAQEPLVGELLNKIEISSAADHIKISASLSEDLIQKLSEKVKPKPKPEEIPAPEKQN